MAKNTNNTYRRKFIPDIAIPNAHISGRPNFSGSERTHMGRVVNSAGNRNFCVDIPEEGVMLNDSTQAFVSPEELIEQGWPLKIHNGSEDDSLSYYLPIKVNFGYRPPLVYTVIGDRRVQIDESMIDTFDGRTFSKVDLIVHPSVRQDWDTGETRISAYLNEGWFYVAQSPFEEAWNNEHPEEDV